MYPKLCFYGVMVVVGTCAICEGIPKVLTNAFLNVIEARCLFCRFLASRRCNKRCGERRCPASVLSKSITAG